jgi:hypothetical protein
MLTKVIAHPHFVSVVLPCVLMSMQSVNRPPVLFVVMIHPAITAAPAMTSSPKALKISVSVTIMVLVAVLVPASAMALEPASLPTMKPVLTTPTAATATVNRQAISAQQSFVVMQPAETTSVSPVPAIQNVTGTRTVFREPPVAARLEVAVEPVAKI